MDWIVIILGWLLFNTWFTLIAMRVYQVYCEDWMDLGCIAFMSIFSPVPILFIRWIRKIITRG